MKKNRIGIRDTGMSSRFLRYIDINVDGNSYVHEYKIYSLALSTCSTREK